MPLLTTGAIADDYIALCQNPLGNLQLWLAENKKPKAYGSDPSTARMNEQIPSSRLATAAGFRQDSLRELQGRLDAYSRLRENAHSLSSRPRTGAVGDEGLRSLRAKADGSAANAAQPSAGIDSEAGDFKGELAAVDAYYRARIAAARQNFSPAAMIRALRAERIVAVRAVLERWQQSARNAADRRMLATLRQNEARPILSLRRTLD
jgi:hypothetical protein